MKCKYCDTGTGPRNIDGDLVCNGCGAEWAAAKTEISRCVACDRLMKECVELWLEQRCCCPDCRCTKK